ncbi:SRPBCC family protein [Lentzea nigeriaca]|uniref:SRPBCC family protein n=1 Tax=Lentzea nigeriaca TaxID=1128665 RepID=UPI00195E98CB|nr:SRPBCC family protein [Lentzea nigeriaca]MBM7864300.1 hypothetical protein [Lentzea nigeriaca]
MTSTVKRAASGSTPNDMLRDSLQNLALAVVDRAAAKVTDRVTGAAGRITDLAHGEGGGLASALTGSKKSGDKGASTAKPGLAHVLADVASHATEVVGEQVVEQLKDKVKGVAGGVLHALPLGGNNKQGGNKLKLTNIVEQIDVGVPIQVAYDQWTMFTDFPSFMKKVENVEQESDEKLVWTAKVWWSRRTWTSTIIEQVPDERIVWRSEGDKGYVDGAVTFHELTPDLTRILLILEYHPHGLFERTGNLWRAQGRRARLELKNFQRHVMTNTILHADDLEGWRGEIHGGQVVDDDESDAYEDDSAVDEDEQWEDEDEDLYDEDEEAEDEEAENDEEYDEDEDEDTEDVEEEQDLPNSRRAGRRAARRA